MKLPTVHLTERQAVFDAKLRRFLTEHYPSFVLTEKLDRSAKRLLIKRGRVQVLEIKCLPEGSYLQLDILSLHADDEGLAEALYQWLRDAFKGKLHAPSRLTTGAPDPAPVQSVQLSFDGLLDPKPRKRPEKR